MTIATAVPREADSVAEVEQGVGGVERHAGTGFTAELVAASIQHHLDPFQPTQMLHSPRSRRHLAGQVSLGMGGPTTRSP
jgi:hypothetical protein